MAYVDFVFKRNCEKILAEGVKDEGDIRAKWEDGTPAHTYHIFGVMNRYDLSDGNEFPILTLRRTAWKSALDEILWIYQKNSNKVSDLNSHIWDQWEGPDGTIGKAYGYQVGKKYEFSDASAPMSQMTKVLYDLNNNPNSRRIMISMWNVEELKDMNLQPCAWSIMFNVTGNKLNAMVNQRSQDMLTAGNWNVVQYALLLMMVAKATGYETGELIHVIGDCHIYDRHIPLVEEMLASKKTLPLRGPIIGKDIVVPVKDFYSYTVDDIQINNYSYQEFNHKIPVAI